jgi:hypothetical protein
VAEHEAPKEPLQAAASQSRVPSFFSHPAVVTLSFISAIAGLVGLPVSFYFYYAAKDYPQLSYYVVPAKAVIVKAGQVSKLTASYDNKVVSTDITAAQIALWNEGSKTIKGADVLRPVTIHVDNTQILEATVRKASREVVRLEIGTEELQGGIVHVSWNLLERGDGGVVQLIYAGNPNVNIYAEGVIEGQPKLVQQSDVQTGTSHKSLASFLLTLAVLWLVMVVYRFFRQGRMLGDVGWLMLIASLVSLIGGSLLLYMSRDAGPPFGL